MTIATILDLSTAHVTQRDGEILSAIADNGVKAGFTVGAYGEYGWFLSVPELEHVPERETMYREAGLSATFCAVVAHAEKQGANFILFDRDGDFEGGLPLHDW